MQEHFGRNESGILIALELSRTILRVGIAQGDGSKVEIRQVAQLLNADADRQQRSNAYRVPVRLMLNDRRHRLFFVQNR